MSRRAALFALACALIGLGASVAAAYTHYHLLYDPTSRSFCDVSATVSCTQVYQSRFGTFQGIPVAVFGATVVRRGGAAVCRRPDRAAPGAGERPRLSLRHVDARPRRHPVSRLCVVRAAESRVSAVPDHVCRGDRAVSGIRRGHLVSHDHIASPRLPRRPRLRLQPAGADARVLFFAGAASTLAFFPREAAPAAAAPGEAAAASTAPEPTQNQRASSNGGTPRSRACRSSCRPKGRRCWS